MALAGGALPDDIKTLTFPAAEADIVELLKFAGFASSNSEARRHISGNGVRLGDNVVTDINLIVDLSGGAVLRFGKGKIVRICSEAPLNNKEAKA